MPIQPPQWTDFLLCPICSNEYDHLHLPITFICTHSICKPCLLNLHRKQCPFDQISINRDLELFPVNYALLQLTSSYQHKDKDDETLLVKNGLSEEDITFYTNAVKCIEEIALYMKHFAGGVNILSRPMQRKIVMLINNQLLDKEGRIRTMKTVRSLGERIVTELIIQHQNPQQLSTNLWTAIRARGCQFLGPAMQEEIIKLVLLALEDGCALSRKVLVMFIVQRLQPHFIQASKTSIGHAVQLLYRASVFSVARREDDSSLMQLKEEYRTYESLRRKHDMEIVEIALNSGLRIAPDQWSSLLYGDVAHKSHMQSIVDKLQSPQSFDQSIQELVLLLQRTGDPTQLSSLRIYFEKLANIGTTTDGNYVEVSNSLNAANTIMKGFVTFMKTYGTRYKHNTDLTSTTSNVVKNLRYKVNLCRDLIAKGSCPRGLTCTFAHDEDELQKYRMKDRKILGKGDSTIGSSSDKELEKMNNWTTLDMLGKSSKTDNRSSNDKDCQSYSYLNNNSYKPVSKSNIVTSVDFLTKWNDPDYYEKLSMENNNIPNLQTKEWTDVKLKEGSVFNAKQETCSNENDQILNDMRKLELRLSHELED